MITPNPAIQAMIPQAMLEGPQVKPPAGASPSADFGQQLMDMLKEVNTSQQTATDMQQNLITGAQPVEVQDVMIAMEKASTLLQLTMAVRNKMLDAYQEIEKLQV